MLIGQNHSIKHSIKQTKYQLFSIGKKRLFRMWTRNEREAKPNPCPDGGDFKAKRIWVSMLFEHGLLSIPISLPLVWNIYLPWFLFRFLRSCCALVSLSRYLLRSRVHHMHLWIRHSRQFYSASSTFNTALIECVLFECKKKFFFPLRAIIHKNMRCDFNNPRMWHDEILNI